MAGNARRPPAHAGQMMAWSPGRADRLAALVALLLAAWLRFAALALDSRFHPDEALFVAFARGAAVQGYWLLPGPLDKPPLALYAQALAMAAAGVTALPDGVLTLEPRAGEFAARLPGALASLALVAALGGAARRLYGRRVGLLALGLAALSPYLVAFSATAFTDSLMLPALGLALWAAAGGRWRLAGLWLALAFGCKHQALLFLPLLALLAWERRGKRRWGALLALALPSLAAAAALSLWDAARAEPAGVWALAVANNDPGRLIHLDEMLPRLAAWGRYAGFAAGPPPLTAALAALAAVVLVARARQPRRPDARTDLRLAAYCLGYSLLHTVIAFNLYDRYLLIPLLPGLLLLARGLDGLAAALRRPAAVWAALGLLALAALPAATDAAQGRAPVGADRGQHAGIDALADYLNAQPLGTIIYDRWLGWELSYYLGAWSDKRRVYYPTPSALAAGARCQPDPAVRYFAVPAWVDPRPWLEALAGAGFGIRLDYDDGRFRAYALTPPRQAAPGASAAGSSWPDRTPPCGR